MNIPITCTVCGEEVDENRYASHMLTKHPKGQVASIQMKKNLPPTPGLPPGISEADLPDAEFMKTIAEMEEAKNTPPPSPKPMQQAPNLSKPMQEPVKLTYKYTGNCQCGNGVATLEMDVEGKHFVIAYCLIEKKQVESRQVVNLDSPAKHYISPSLSGAGEKKTPPVVAKTSPLPPSAVARVNDKPQKDLTGGVK
jgi:hypothetical protein